MLINLAILVCAFVTALVGTPLVIRLARGLQLVDEPGLRKVHLRAIPRVGGVAIVVAVLAGLTPIALARWARLSWLFDYPDDPTFSITDAKVLAFMGGGLLVFLVGLVDDIRSLPARWKLAVQVVAALLVCSVGIRIESLGIPVLMEEPLRFGLLSWPITVLWIVGITNAVNLIDGLDGLAAGIGLVAILVILTISLIFGEAQMVSLSLALAGAVAGFLVFNFNPARIFMGDCGSFFLGFMVATGSVVFSCTKSTFVGLTLPALALGVPIFDTLISVLRRVLNRRSPFAADGRHIHHRLLKAGIGHRRAVLILYGVTLLVSGASLLAIVVERESLLTLVLLAMIVLGLVVFFRAHDMVDIGKGLQALSNKFRLSLDSQQARRIFAELQLRFMEAESFAAWWRAVEEAGKALDFSRIETRLEQRDGTSRSLLWQSQTLGEEEPEQLQATVPVRQRRAGEGSLRISVVVNLRGGLESASSRLAQFARLLEEAPLALLTAAEGSDHRNRGSGDHPPGDKAPSPP